MSAELLALLKSDPAVGILAVADLRERRISVAVRCGNDWMAASAEHDDLMHLWVTPPDDDRGGAEPTEIGVIDSGAGLADDQDLAEHIASEANPDHALAAVKTWRLVAGAIAEGTVSASSPIGICVADEARAYLGGAS